ncbi:MAG: 16S rRNA (guanine(966)-N(2))-methyltransferase RsmD [Roseburia sp.]|nr:16S rRNA (guanine(966)-N(2))-methyltransferase RsmD [Anaeroplasma bactoclasticum]MCM1196852.1 16S rRNA (guanine(966)-N(2))-methyltransferase RsmD [Roseburia sp.]MCM1557021.1 16S rRNA (guanine(966)-N(2))-methyltransferase RsmD [Anaeroplasma bactoclasticum]
MRIVAGKLRHRSIEMTNLETTRETQDKVRGAIFNMIGPYFDGGKALDLFAGSGAMAIEAYSRGVNEIDFNDIEPKAIEICKKNCFSLGIKEANFTTLDYKQFLKQSKKCWNLIFLDPPYKMNAIKDILNEVYPHIAHEGIVVFELAKESIYPLEFMDLKVLKNKEYGIKRVLVYKRGGEK